MPYLTTGLLDNPSVEGSMPSTKLSVKISNDDTSTVAVQVEGFFQNRTTKVKYVEEFFTLAAGTVALKNYMVPFKAYEFEFFVSSQAVDFSVWSKDVTGNLTETPLLVTKQASE